VADDLYYGDAALGRRVFAATAIVTAPVAFSTAAGTGGPLLWNNSTDTIGRVIRVSYAVTTASTAAGALGWTGGTGQTTAPSSTTAIDSITNCYIGGPKPKITAYRVGTVSNAGAFFIPLGQVGTTALTALPDQLNIVDVERLVVIPQNGGWWSMAGSAALTTAVIQISVWWEEIYIG
jgi:hypothetical protein